MNRHRLGIFLRDQKPAASSGPAAPTDIALSAAAVAESATIGTVIGTFSSDVAGATFTLTSDPDGKFSISGNQLLTAASLNYEAATSHSITVRATNAGGSYSELFTITVTDVDEPPLDGLSGLTGAWSAGRQLLTAYGGSFIRNVSGNCDLLYDQSGSARDFTRSTAAARPLIATAGPNSRGCLDFRPSSVDGTNDSMEGPALSNFISNTTGYLVVSFIPDDAGRTSFTTTNIHLNDSIIQDASSKFGVVTTGGNVSGFNNDGSFDIPTASAVTNGTAYVYELWHDSGNINARLNGGTTQTTASGNTNALTGLLRLGALSNQVDFKFFEMAFFSTVPSSTERDALVAAFRAWCGA